VSKKTQPGQANLWEMVTAKKREKREEKIFTFMREKWQGRDNSGDKKKGQIADELKTEDLARSEGEVRKLKQERKALVS